MPLNHVNQTLQAIPTEYQFQAGDKVEVIQDVPIVDLDGQRTILKGTILTFSNFVSKHVCILTHSESRGNPSNRIVFYYHVPVECIKGVGTTTQNKCTCDFHKVIMIKGCQCGGI